MDNSPQNGIRSLKMVQKVTARLKRRFSWIDDDELASYAYIGLRKASSSFDPNRSADFGAFASVKGMYLAIDEMRHDGLVQRQHCATSQSARDVDEQLQDPGAADAMSDLVNRDLTEALLCALPEEDRDLLMMYYCQSMTLREIGQVRGVSEAAVCVRHQQLIRKLRRFARRMGLLGKSAATAATGARNSDDYARATKIV
ncbi:MAG: sigma-70 family RNA polymerase sigma factor [Phycisphaerae bacterium]